ncbi:hypothetical protein HMI56_007451 [Coelomomyces lativittatus]|nr:hypothetical protein HMI56_007451 [Coelomomyces lativittatus]
MSSQSFSEIYPILTLGNSNSILSDSLLLKGPPTYFFDHQDLKCIDIKMLDALKFKQNSTITTAPMEIKLNLVKVDNLSISDNFIDSVRKLELRLSFYCNGRFLGNVYSLPMILDFHTSSGSSWCFSINPNPCRNSKFPENKLLARFLSHHLDLSIFFEIVQINETINQVKESSLYWTALMLFNSKGTVIGNTKLELTFHKIINQNPFSSQFHPSFFTLGKLSASSSPILYLSTSTLEKKWKNDSSLLSSYLITPVKSLPLLALIQQCLKDEENASTLGISADPFLGFIWPWVNSTEKLVYLSLLCYNERKGQKRSSKDLSLLKLKSCILSILAEIQPISSELRVLLIFIFSNLIYHST